MRSQPVGQTDRHAPPCLDEEAIFGIRWIVLGNAVAFVEAVFVMQRRWLEALVLLEGERSGIALATAIVKDLEAALT